MEHRDTSVVGVIVPTLNAARTLEACLASLREQSLVPRVVVVDAGSTDGSVAIARRYADIVLEVDHPGFSTQRNAGVKVIGTRVLGFLDADMVLEPTVVEEAVTRIREGAAGVIVPEVSVGSSFWARVRAFERSFYVDASSAEAARFFSLDVYSSIGGYDEELSAVEDRAMSEAASMRGPLERTEAIIFHDEGTLNLASAIRKKAAYAGGIEAYTRRYGLRSLFRFLFDRPYLWRPWRLIAHPLLACGLVVLKTGESIAVSISLLARSSSRSASGGTGTRGSAG